MPIRWLDSISQHDAAVVGGKGANLGELIRLGLPVPPGFCITAQAYAVQMESWDLAGRISPLIERQDWEGVARTMHEVCTTLPLSETLAVQVLKAYHEMGSPPVAVRSSATAEDLADASFAGQQETFLTVCGDEELLSAVRRCWASLWGTRALHYRQQRNINHVDVNMSVVVQEMVPASAAGVLFTVDPTANRTDRLLVEAAPGLGEAVVSGAVAGDIYRVDRSGSLAVAGREVRQPGRQVLTDDEVLGLCRMALKLESHFGCPQDVEFAVAGGKLYLLQSRPITTIAGVQPEELPSVGKPNARQKIVLAKAAERFPIAPKPLDNLALNVLIETPRHGWRALGLTTSDREEARIKALIWRQVYTLPSPRPTPGVLTLPARLKRLWSRDWLTWWERGHRERLLAVTIPVNVAELSDAALFERADRVREAWVAAFGERFAATFSMYAAEGLIKAMTTMAVGRHQAPRMVADLLSGLHTITQEVNQRLWELSRLVQQNPTVAEAVETGNHDRVSLGPAGEELTCKFDQFMGRYGHRESTTWYISTPTWRQNPAQVWGLLRGMARIEALPEGSGMQRYEAARQRVLSGLRPWFLLPRFFAWLLDRLRHLHVFEENSHFDLTRPLDALQELAGEWGRRLFRRGLLAQPEDVCYLTFDEVKAWLLQRAPSQEEARQLLLRRQATYPVVNGRWMASLFEAGGSGNELRGHGASSGVARARARIVRDESEFGRLQAGEVLVCPYSNPAWTPLFASAAAVVAETGGVASHAAIVAREYGIPAVMGVPGATRRIADGQELLVDGDTGRIVLGAMPDAAAASSHEVA